MAVAKKAVEISKARRGSTVSGKSKSPFAKPVQSLAVKNQKVVQLPRPLAPEENLLTEAEREQYVINFREKGRKVARAILRRWQSRLDLDEIQSLVDLSLCEAARRFDPSRGVHFITFLYYHLKGNLVRAIDSAVWNTLLPSIADGSAQEIGRQELPFSALDLSEALTSEPEDIPEDIMYRREIELLSQEARQQLDPLEREVVERIYIKGQQLIDVANTLGYSRCHISRIKKRALLFLHRELRDGVEHAGYGSGLEDLA